MRDFHATAAVSVRIFIPLRCYHSVDWSLKTLRRTKLSLPFSTNSQVIHFIHPFTCLCPPL